MRHGCLRRSSATAASTRDSKHFEAVIGRGNTSRDVYADRGYTSADREIWRKERGYRNHIPRKGRRNKPLSECQQRRIHRVAKTRARVEHVFASIEQRGGKLIRTIGQRRANFAMTMMAVCDDLKRLVYFQKAAIKAF